MVKRPTISACIITKNEEKFIGDCLESLKGVVDEIIVIDDYSSDQTLKICKKYTDRIYRRKMITFSDQRNYAFSKAQMEWIFFIDADEMLSEELRKNLRKLTYTKKYDCYAFSRKTFIKPQYWIKHGRFYPDYKIRLFRKKNFLGYKGVIHETPIYTGNLKKIDLDILHNQIDRNTIYNPEMYQEYLSFEIRKTQYRGGKYRVFYLFKSVAAFFYCFIRDYFFLKGYKDGFIGLIEAFRWAKYRFWANLAKALK